MDASYKVEILEKEGVIVEVRAFFPLLTKEKDGNYFVQCPLFKTLGYSQISLKDAFEDHKKDLEAFFGIHIKRETLKGALVDLAWKKADGHYSPSQLPDYIQRQIIKNDEYEYREVA